jgi:hypothetical protein
MAESRSDPNRDDRNMSGQSPRNLPERDSARRALNRRFRCDDRAYQIESDLSATMVVSARELDAIIRLLGTALDGILSDFDLP